MSTGTALSLSNVEIQGVPVVGNFIKGQLYSGNLIYITMIGKISNVTLSGTQIINVLYFLTKDIDNNLFFTSDFTKTPIQFLVLATSEGFSFSTTPSTPLFLGSDSGKLNLSPTQVKFNLTSLGFDLPSSNLFSGVVYSTTSTLNFDFEYYQISMLSSSANYENIGENLYSVNQSSGYTPQIINSSSVALRDTALNFMPINYFLLGNSESNVDIPINSFSQLQDVVDGSSSSLARGFTNTIDANNYFFYDYCTIDNFCGNCFGIWYNWFRRNSGNICNRNS